MKKFPPARVENMQKKFQKIFPGNQKKEKRFFPEIQNFPSKEKEWFFFL